MSDEAPAQRGRKRKFSAERVEELLVEAAKENVLENGVSWGLSTVRLDHLLALTEVPRGAGYEQFSHPELAPQAALHRATVLSIVRDLPAGNAPATRDAALTLIDELADDINSSDLERRRSARGAIVRAVADFNHSRLNSRSWRVYRSLVETALSQPEPDAEIVGAIRVGEEQLLDAYQALFEEFSAVLRMEPIEGMGFRVFTMTVYALNDGLSNRVSDTYQSQEVVIEGERWSAFALGCEALFERYFRFVDQPQPGGSHHR